MTNNPPEFTPLALQVLILAPDDIRAAVEHKAILLSLFYSAPRVTAFHVNEAVKAHTTE